MQSLGSAGPLAKTILVVEDDPIGGIVLRDFLQAHGYRVVLAKTGTDGVEAFARSAPDLALVDILLPRKNGFEVCFDIRRTEHGAAIPVLLMSAVVREDEPPSGVSLADTRPEGFLVKPFQLVDLLDRVQALIGEATKPWGPRGPATPRAVAT